MKLDCSSPVFLDGKVWRFRGAFASCVFFQNETKTKHFASAAPGTAAAVVGTPALTAVGNSVFTFNRMEPRQRFGCLDCFWVCFGSVFSGN